MDASRRNGAASTMLEEDHVSAALERLVAACIAADIGAEEFSDLAKDAAKRIKTRQREERIRQLDALGEGARVRYKAIARAEADATYHGRATDRPDMVRISTTTYQNHSLSYITVDPLKVSPPNRRQLQ